MRSRKPQGLPELDLDHKYLKDISKKNKDSVKRNVEYHTMRPCSYPMKRHLLVIKTKSIQHKRSFTLNQEKELLDVHTRQMMGHLYIILRKLRTRYNRWNLLPDKTDKHDPYHDVFTKKEHSGRLWLYGRGVTKTNLKECEDNPPFVLPSMYMESIEEHLEKKITSRILSQLKQAFPAIDAILSNLSTTLEDGDQDGSSGTSPIHEKDSTNGDQQRVDIEWLVMEFYSLVLMVH